jgi:RNA polymerase sigma-70 factor, ECF subfamily
MENQPLESKARLARDIATCRPALLRRARTLVGPVDADDLVQSTIERALAHLDDFEPQSNLIAWLRRIMFTRTIDDWRCHKRRYVSLEAPEELPCEEEEHPPFWAGLTREDVAAAVRALSPRFRTVFELHHEWGLSYDEVERELKIPFGTVGTRLRRARLHLRRELTAVLLEREGWAEAPGRRVTVALVPAVRRADDRAASAGTSPSLAAVA